MFKTSTSTTLRVRPALVWTATRDPAPALTHLAPKSSKSDEDTPSCQRKEVRKASVPSSIAA